MAIACSNKMELHRPCRAAAGVERTGDDRVGHGTRRPSGPGGLVILEREGEPHKVQSQPGEPGDSQQSQLPGFSQQFQVVSWPMAWAPAYWNAAGQALT